MTSGKSHNLSSTIEEIENAIDGSTTRHIPLIKVVDVMGHDVWVNANQIEAIQVYARKSPTSG